MQEFYISIRSLQELLDFVALAQTQPFSVMAGNDRQWVSAKSHMGMCSLECSEPILVQATCDNDSFLAFRQAAQPFLLP